MHSATHIVGILNLTPDSFSDGNAYASTEDALRHIEHMVMDGASVIDIGAESTRPNAKLLSHTEEWDRLHPVLKVVAKEKIPAQISIDTRHAETAEKALALGVAWINDVSGLNSHSMLNTLKESTCKTVLMHSLTVPANKDIVIPEEVDVIEALLAWAEDHLQKLAASGIKKERIVFDPGIGFGKTAQQSMRIIKEAEKFKALGVPVMFGHSRKSFLSLVTEKPAEARDAETALISAYLAHKGIEFLRVHNVKASMNALLTPFTCPEWLK